MGRVLRPEDDAHPDVVVLPFETWRRTFEADPNVRGTTIELRAAAGPARLLTVVGVLPPDFESIAGVIDFYTPIALDPSRPSPFVAMIGRLSAGVSLDAATAEANQLGEAIRAPRAADAPPL